MEIKKIDSSPKTKQITNDLTPEHKPAKKAKNEEDKKNFNIEESLEKEKSRYIAYIHTKKLPLAEQIKQVVMAYNQVIYQIIRIEEEYELQYDQYIQHFLMSKHKDFLTFGISIQNSIYLEFNTVEIRNAIDQYGEKAIEKKLFSEQGLFSQLLNSINLTIDKLNNHRVEFGKTGRRFDFKA